MKTFFKTTTSLVLIIVFLLACMISMFLLFAASWLHTYKSFTREETVAEVRISEQKEDELGKYVDVEFTPIETGQSALSRLFVGEDNQNPIKLQKQTFKIYGDTVYIGGPILKFKDGLILFNFKTAYKMNLVFGRYDEDPEAENKRTPEMASNFYIGSADTNYRSIANDIRKDSWKGKIYKIFLDSEPQMKPTGIFVTDQSVEGKIVVRNDGFKWNAE